MKALVETTGQFALHDLIGQQTVEAYRPCVVEMTPFMERHRGERLTVLETLADEASDADLAAAADEDALYAAIEALPRAEKVAKKAPARAKA